MPKRDPSTIRIEGEKAYVSLSRGLEAIIDANDLPVVEGYAWYATNSRTGHVYAARSGGNVYKVILMHREILNAPRGNPVDHRDGNGINNSRRNIRIATSTLNNANVGVTKRNILGIKGVRREKTGRFSAKIAANGKRIFLGCFDTVDEASAAYYAAAIQLFGDFARK